MAIKVSNTTVIDDDRNITSVGIATVGSGSSAITLNGTTGNINVGTGVTIEGSGRISIAGTISAKGLNVPAQIVSFTPANGATNVPITSTLDIIYNQAVGIATTGTILLKSGSAGGTTIGTLGVSDVLSTTNGIRIKSPTPLPYGNSIFPVIPNGFVKSTSGDIAGINTTGGTSYGVTIKPIAGGDPAGGGFFLCQSGTTRWIVAPSASEVSRNWYTKADANSSAIACTGCTGWFVPTSAQLQNPGYVCRNYWDSYSNIYWSNTDWNGINGTPVSMVNGVASAYYLTSNPFERNCRNTVIPVRSFRCVTYS